MRRRYRKGSSRRRGRRSYKRRYRRAGKALRLARSINRKIDAEVKKQDVNAIIPEGAFTQITPALGTAADNASSLPDFAYLYNVFNTGELSTGTEEQGIRVGDFVGERVRAKYLYLGFHLQMPVRPSDTTSSAQTIQQPLCIRIMIVQDRNYNAAMSANDMITALFGVAQTTTGEAAYVSRADYTLLPINPQQPGRFNVIRDFKMNVAPGYRMDYYKKVMLLQKDLYSSGRFYAGLFNPSSNLGPAESESSWSNMRNRIYALVLYQSPTLYGVAQTGSPDFTLSIQSRLAYYDN